MGVRVDRAMVEVRKVFGQYPKPKMISYCSQCYAEDEVRAFTARSVSTLSESDLRPILFNGCTCFGCWSEVSHYVPRLLEVTEQTCGCFAFELQRIFLVAARVKLNSMLAFPENVESEMALGARRAIFNLGQSLLEDDLEDTTEDASWSLRRSLSFLAAFDEPIEPLLDRLQHHKNIAVRMSFMIMVAELASGLETFDDCSLAKWSLMPENQPAFDILLAPTYALEMIMTHIDEISGCWSDTGEVLSNAFDRLVSIN